MKRHYENYMIDDPVSVRPMMEVGGFLVRPGMFDINGATELPVGVNFTIHTHGGTSCELLLFRRGQEEPYAVIPFPEAYKIGDVYSMIVYELKVEEFEYAYRIDGPYDPEKGLLFNKETILLDPYAKAVAGQRTWGEKRKATYHARVVKDTFDWGDMPQSSRELNELIIYELHVRGFTQHPSSGVEHRGTFDGLREKIPYLKELGVNAVELMPIFEFDETINARDVNGQELLEYWGYNTVNYFSPNTSYAAKDEMNKEGLELKRLIQELHKNGIEVILDIVFNHTAEGDENGPNFCFKGIDNNIYYILGPEGNYYNFSGCGNTLNCNQPIVQQMILECLRYWTINYRVDGFRFDLASILGRNENGEPMEHPPLLKTLAYDPVLRNVKLIAEAWDAGGMYQVGRFPANRRWAEWNGRYRDSLRSYLKGDFWEAWNAAWSVAGSGDLYGGYDSEYNEYYAGYNSCVNFLTCHDGFTMRDLYSYNEKHNENNGWNNTDGANDNRSWNCGVEGDTDDPEILALRRRMIRNAAAVLLCSRGTPMFLAGDEFGNTQYGNNNGYCQDNEISWLDWNLLEKNKELFEFFKFMIAYRKDHKVIRKKLPDAHCGMEGLHAHSADANNVSIARDAKIFSCSFAGYDETKEDDDLVYITINSNWEPTEITLPDISSYGKWHLSADTFDTGDGRFFYPEGEEPAVEGRYYMHPRTVAVFTGRSYAYETKPGKKSKSGLYKMHFSPTGGTRKVADILSEEWDCNMDEINLMDPNMPNKEFSKNDVCIVAVPVFGGRVPKPALQNLEKMKGNKAKAILTVVYGNRAYEDALVELKDTMDAAGFFCVAAVAAVAEHSIVHKFAHGRPDAEDIKRLHGFAKKIREHLENDEQMMEVNVPGNRPYREYHGVPLKPEGTKGCIGCKICAIECPVQAIPLNHPESVEREKCISCMHCVAVCPKKIRKNSKVLVMGTEQKIKKACSGRKESELFL